MPRRWPTALAKLAICLVLIAVAALLGFAVVLEPVLLLGLAGGVLVGAAIRFWAARRSRHPGEPPRAKPAAFKWVVVAILGVVAAVIGVSGAFNLKGSGVPPNATPSAREVARAHYEADLHFQSHGDWSGPEWFTLTAAEARRLLIARRGSLAGRLRVAVPDGWTVLSDQTAGETSFRVQRAFPSDPFHVPAWRPLTITIRLPTPELATDRMRLPLLPARGSTMTLHAPEKRVLATTPSSSASQEAGSRVARAVALDVPNGDGDVEVEIESTLATHLKQEWIGHGSTTLILGILGFLGFSVTVARRHVLRFLRWLTHRRPPAPVERVLRGSANKTGAVTEYLARRGTTGEDAEARINLLVFDARTIATQMLANAEDRHARKRYDAASSRLRAEGRLGSLDIVYAALRAAGASREDLDALDSQLDAKLLATRRPVPA